VDEEVTWEWEWTDTWRRSGVVLFCKGILTRGDVAMLTAELAETEGAIWSRVIDPGKPTLSQPAARGILALDFPESDKERMRELAAKARQGELTAEEESEIDVYGRVGSVLSILKSKARKSLRKSGNGKH
jgi:hypothetical protein